MIKEKQCGQFGTLKLRTPNVPEAMMLLGKMGINSKTASSINDFENNDLYYVAKLIESLEPFVSEINLNIKGKQITTYKDVLMEFAMMPYLTEMATELFESLNWTEEKKE